MNNDKATLTKRLDGLAEVLTETTNFSCYAHTVYEANAALDRQAAQIAMLSGVLDKVRECTPSGYVFEIVIEVLTATQADVEQWEKSKRDAVREVCAAICRMRHASRTIRQEGIAIDSGAWLEAEKCATTILDDSTFDRIRALKDTKP